MVVFSFGLSWIFTTLGLLMRAPNAVMNAGFMGIFPLTFLSNVFVDPDTLPSALEAFVNVNPISILADASRGFMEGNVDAGDVGISLGVVGGADRGLPPDHDPPVPQQELSHRSRRSRRRRPWRWGAPQPRSGADVGREVPAGEGGAGGDEGGGLALDDDSAAVVAGTHLS